LNEKKFVWDLTKLNVADTIGLNWLKLQCMGFCSNCDENLDSIKNWILSMKLTSWLL